MSKPPRSPSNQEPLAEALRHVPDEVFWRDGTQSTPDYNAVFAWYLRRFYGLTDPEATFPIGDLEEGRLVNLSTFQKSVATERARRTHSS